MIDFKNCKYYVINLEKDKDRLNACKKEFDRVGLQVERYNAVTIKDYEELKNYKTLPRQSNKLTEISCFLSHYNLLKENIGSDKNVCIFEDDVGFCDDFNERLEYIDNNFKTEDWDIFFLSSFYHLNSDEKNKWHDYEYEVTDKKYIHKTFSSFCCHSYVVNKNSIEKIIKYIDDNQLDTMAIDHILIYFQENERCYAFSPGCTFQVPCMSSIKGVMIDQQNIFYEACGKHIYSKKLSDFKYYDFFTEDAFPNLKLFKKLFVNPKNFDQEYEVYLENYMNEDYNISKYKENELNEYNFIGDYMCNFPKDSLFVDVGSNYGLAAIAVASRGYKVFGFEPVRSNYYVLNKNIEHNNFENFVITENSALGDTNGQTSIYIPAFKDNCSMNQEAAVLNMKSKWFKEEKINVLKFDDWLSKTDVDKEKIKFIKIDTQGFEYQVLLGMKNFLENYKGIHILLEWDNKLTSLSGNSLELVEKFLVDLGFRHEPNSSIEDRIFIKD